jgi:hypothetical protein
VLLQAQILAPFLPSAASGSLDAAAAAASSYLSEGGLQGAGAGGGGHTEMTRQIGERMAHLYDFFKQLYDKDHEEIRWGQEALGRVHVACC